MRYNRKIELKSINVYFMKGKVVQFSGEWYKQGANLEPNVQKFDRYRHSMLIDWSDLYDRLTTQN